MYLYGYPQELVLKFPTYLLHCKLGMTEELETPRRSIEVGNQRAIATKYASLIRCRHVTLS